MAARPFRKITSVNPFNNELVEEFEFITNDDLKKSIQTGHEAFQRLKKQTYAEKADKLKNLISILQDKTLEIAQIITVEMGKPITESKTEVQRTVSYIQKTLDKGEAFLTEEMVATEAKKSYVRYEPLGLVYFIIPFNYPFYLTLKYVATNLLIGNTALVRNADSTPNLGRKISEIVHKAGFNGGEYSHVLTSPDQLETILSDQRVKGVKFTGSSVAGSHISSVAGKYLKKCLLELGGSDPFIVLPDAKLDFAADLALRARLTNAGQICCSPKRFIVHESVYEEFKKLLVEKVAAYICGDPKQETTKIGPLARADLLANVERQVKEGINQGAKVLAGGVRPSDETLIKGNYFLPTIVEVKRDNLLFNEEVFGPVLPLVTFTQEEEAIEIANNSNYGLGGIIVSEDRSKAEQLASQIDTGMVFINHHVMSDPRLPFGGVKSSGGGRDGGKFSLLNFTNIKTVWVD